MLPCGVLHPLPLNRNGERERARCTLWYGVVCVSGTFVMEYVGEVLDYRAFKSRTRRYARENCEHHYFMALSADEVIDSAKKGNVSRFINHCCDPNAETQKVC